MPSRLFQPPYTGVAVVQYFAYRWQDGHTVGATEAEVREILTEAANLYLCAHPIRSYGGGPQFQTPEIRSHGSPLVLRVLPDRSRP